MRLNRSSPGGAGTTEGGGRVVSSGDADIVLEGGPNIGEYISRHYPADSDALRAQPGVTRGITFRLVSAGGAFAIHLDCETISTAEEIQHLGAGRMLTTKSQASWTLPKLLPEQYLRQGHLAT